MDRTTAPKPEKQQEGNFVAFENPRKGDGLPSFVGGRISIPGHDDEFPFSFWAHKYEKTDKSTGEVTKHTSFGGVAGDIARGASAMERVNAMGEPKKEGTEISQSGVTLRDRQIVLFENGFKADAPEKDRPDFWGMFYPGDGQPIVRISVWARTKNERVVFTGRTSYPIPGKSEAEMQDMEVAPEQTLDDLLEQGAVAKGDEGIKKGRGKRTDASATR